MPSLPCQRAGVLALGLALAGEGLGDPYLKLGQRSEALAELEPSLEVKPDSLAPQQGVCHIRLAMGRRRQALAVHARGSSSPRPLHARVLEA